VSACVCARMEEIIVCVYTGQNVSDVSWMYITGQSQSVNESIITLLEQGALVNKGLIIYEIIVLSQAPSEVARGWGWHLWVRNNRELYDKKVHFYLIKKMTKLGKWRLYSVIKRDKVDKEIYCSTNFKCPLLRRSINWNSERDIKGTESQWGS